MAEGTIYTCANRDPNADGDGYAEFFPVLVGALKDSNQKIQYGAGRCFEEINFSYDLVYNGTDLQEVTVWVETLKPKSLLCKDWFFFANTEMQHVETFFFEGTHSITFKNLNADAKKDLAFNGLQVYMFCEGYIDTFISVFKTLLAFVGGLSTDPNLPIIGSHVPWYMEE